MLLDDVTCHAATEAKDRRNDGLFLLAVTSTEIYCRCICPARTPKRQNRRVFAHAAARLWRQHARAKGGARMNTIVHESPVGRLTLTSDGAKLVSVWFEDHRFPTAAAAEQAMDQGEEDGILRQARRELDAYFAGKLRKFAVPLAPRGGTTFQRRVWEALRPIPFGATVTYGDVARQIGAPQAVRAVGGAVGANPLSIVLPCHRVIGASGALTGFGGGLDRKRFLLGIEGHLPWRTS